MKETACMSKIFGERVSTRRLNCHTEEMSIMLIFSPTRMTSTSSLSRLTERKKSILEESTLSILLTLENVASSKKKLEKMPNLRMETSSLSKLVQSTSFH